jgi:Flp pilus assembly protein protease CpaA
MVGVLAVLLPAVGDLAAIVRLVAAVICGGLVYVGMLFLVGREILSEARHALNHALRPRPSAPAASA